MEKFINSNGDFALKLFKQVSQDGKSSFLSPASVTAALAMIYMGAEGSTKGQMNQLMFNGLNDQEINEGMQEVIKAINDPVDGYTLNAANRIYIEKSYQILQTFLDVVQKYHRSDCVSSDFKNNFESVRLEINKWVEDKTNRKIKDLLIPGVVDAMTRLVLVNAIYFKGDWLKEFDEKRTQKRPFHLTADKMVDVDMMHAKLNSFQYTATEECQVLGISYKLPDLAMFFVLPTQRNQLHKLETKLTGPDLIQLFNQVHSGEVEVALPKFKLEDSFDLVKTFQKLGCVDMFSKDADFSKINPKKDLIVSAIVHKAFIEVNEKGAEAAAATAVIMPPGARPMPPPLQPHRFIADHPFLFAIVERKTMSILFLGHYYG